MSDVQEDQGEAIQLFFAQLADPFKGDDIRFRPQGNRQIQYITARTVMNRLDDIAGPQNWWDTYVPRENSVICSLSIRLPDGSVVTKSDAGGYAGMSDSGDDDKSGYSDGFKRAAVKFGIGRHLYCEGIPNFVTRILRIDPESIRMEPPAQPYHGSGGSSTPPARPTQNSNPGPSRPPQGGGGGNDPKTGRALFAWAKKKQEDGIQGVIEWINDYGHKSGFPARMVEWTDAQVAECVREWNGQH